METTVVKDTILRIAEHFPGVKLWRQNTGVGVGWGVVQAAIRSGDWSALKRARPIRFGVPGQADVTGILPDGRRLEIELKHGKGKQREEQVNFQRMIEAAGGVYILARSDEEAFMRLKEETEGRDDEIERLHDIIRWFTFRSGQGSVGLTEEQYELEVMEEQWVPEQD